MTAPSPAPGERKRKFDGKPRQLAKNRDVEAWFYNDPRTVQILVHVPKTNITLSLRINKKKLAEMSRLP